MALRFFRKHRKWFMILVFGGVLGMLGWGVFSSDRFQGLLARIMGGGAGSEVVGRIDGREVTVLELYQFVTGLRAAGRASQVWYRTLAGQADDQEAALRIYQATLEESAWPVLAQQVEDVEQVSRATGLAWLALREEARRFGFETPEVEVDARLERLRGLGLSGQDIADTVVREARGSRDLLIEGLRDDMALAAYLRYLYEALGVPVQPELRRAFGRQDARVRLRLAVFEAEDGLDEVGDPPEDKVREYYTKYKTYLPGGGPDGIGYRIPPKVAVEYLEADPAAFEDEAAEAVNEASVKAYYEEHKDTEFLLEPEDEKKDGDAAEEEKGAEGEEKPAAPTYRPLEEVRDDIRRRLVRREAESLAHNHLASQVGEITTKRKGVDLRIWADGTRVRYNRLPDPMTAGDLAEVEGLGAAARDRTAVPQAALSVVELVGPEKARLAVGEISEVYTGPEGKAYAFRVTGATPSREPTNLDEVRPAVVEDVRQAEAFRIIRERAKRLLEAAAEKGLEAAAKEADVETVTTDWFPRERFIPYGGRWLSFPPSLPEVGSSPTLVAECFEMIEEGRERTLVTLGAKRMVVVAELLGRKAPREARYEQFRPLVAQRVSHQMAGQTLVDLLETGSIQRRMAVTVEEPKKQPKPAPAEEGSGSNPTEPQVPMPDIGR